MATYRGVDGRVYLGGIVTGSPLVKGTVSNGASAATFDGSPLTGVVVPGDHFTVAGDAQVYEIVTGGVVGASVLNEIDVTFTPTVQVASWADNAAVTFSANQASEATAWVLETTKDLLEDTAMGDQAKTFKVGLGEWGGTITAWLDYGDANQKKLIDDIFETQADNLGITLTSNTDKQFFGEITASGLGIDDDLSGIVPVEFNFKGRSPLGVDWS